MADKKEVKVLTLPEGRLINCAFFTRDVYKDPETGAEGKPQYKGEIAFDPKDVTGENTIEDALIDAAVAAWGPDAEDKFINGKIISPFIDGDTLAEKREENGKSGDAYKGKLVCRPNTTFNKHGQDAEGGIDVFDEEVKPITGVNQQEIYPGCYGIAGVTISCYKNNRGEKALKFYLVAFQKTRDGEKLVTPRDNTKLFKPLAKAASKDGEKAEDGGRRRRRAS